MQISTCAECLQAMAQVKNDFLARIACANCQQAQADLDQVVGSVPQSSARSLFGTRCSQCGKWCLTRSALATHLRGHVVSLF
jgi:hypothetical protein